METIGLIAFFVFAIWTIIGAMQDKMNDQKAEMVKEMLKKHQHPPNYLVEKSSKKEAGCAFLLLAFLALGVGILLSGMFPSLLLPK